MIKNIYKLGVLSILGLSLLTSCDEDTVVYNGSDFVMFNQASTSSLSFTESAGTIQIPVNLSTPQSTDVTVNFTITSETAVAGTDYTVVTPTLVIPAGQTVGNIQIALTDDDVFNFSKVLTLKLTGSSLSNVSVGLAGQAGSYEKNLVIANDDCPTQSSLWFGAVTVNESGAAPKQATATGNEDGDCDVLVITGDLGDFGIATASFEFFFTPDFEGATTGTVNVPESLYCTGCSNNLDVFYSAQGIYDEETQIITVDYTVRRSDNAGYNGTTDIYPTP